jgi:hypothetical protein
VKQSKKRELGVSIMALLMRVTTTPVAAAFHRFAQELVELSAVEANAVDMVDHGNAKIMVDLLHTNVKAKAARILANISTFRDVKPYIQAIAQAGAIQPLVMLLDGGIHSETASNAAIALGNLVPATELAEAAVEAGAIAPLVALLAGGTDSEAAKNAAIALTIISLYCSEASRDIIVAAGAIQPLMVLLAAGGTEADDAAEHALKVLVNLSFQSDERADAIVASGSIAPIVALLARGTESDHAFLAAKLLSYLATDVQARVSRRSEARSEAIVAAGGVDPLVALLARGVGDDAAIEAADALDMLASGSDARAALVLDALHRAHPVPPPIRKIDPFLFESLSGRATNALQTARTRLDRVALSEAIARAQLLGAEEDVEDVEGEEGVVVRELRSALRAARALLDELSTAEARRARRESVGLSTSPPDDFVCPLTLEPMNDPVVASDGHSYERAAIADVLAGPNKKSPLTREVLRPELVPNRALRRRIEQHEKELDALAEQLESRMSRATEEAQAKTQAEAEAKARAEAAEAEAEALRKQLEEYKAATAAGSKRAGEEALEPAAKPSKRSRG